MNARFLVHLDPSFENLRALACFLAEKKNPFHWRRSVLIGAQLNSSAQFFHMDLPAGE